MKTILALDLATRTGWCSHGMALKSGFYDMPEKSIWKARLEWWERLQRFTEWLGPTIGGHGALVIEKPGQFRSRDAARVCYSLHYIVREVAHRYALTPVEVTPSTLKKWATGNGKADKDDMLRAVKKWSVSPIKDHNEADAILLAFYAREELGL